MRKHLFLLLLPFVLLACQPEAEAPATDEPATPVTTAGYNAVGQAVEAVGVMPVQAVFAETDQYLEQNVKVEGTVRKVCQNMGCWLTLDAGEGNNIRVNVAKNEDNSYAFTFPTDISGRRVIIEGYLEGSMLDVATQEHLLEDEGKSTEEIAAMDLEPKTELKLTANGALIAI